MSWNNFVDVHVRFGHLRVSTSKAIPRPVTRTYPRAPTSTFIRKDASRWPKSERRKRRTILKGSYEYGRHHPCSAPRAVPAMCGLGHLRCSFAAFRICPTSSSASRSDILSETTGRSPVKSVPTGDSVHCRCARPRAPSSGFFGFRSRRGYERTRENETFWVSGRGSSLRGSGWGVRHG